MTEILRFKAGDRVRVIAGDAEGQLGIVEGHAPDTQPRKPVSWRVALDDGRRGLFETFQLEHAE